MFGFSTYGQLAQHCKLTYKGAFIKSRSCKSSAWLSSERLVSPAWRAYLESAIAKISWPTIVISPRKALSSSQLIRSVMFGFPAKASLSNIASLPRKVSSQPIPSEVDDFPTAVLFPENGGGCTIYVPAYRHVLQGMEALEDRVHICEKRFQEDKTETGKKRFQHFILE